LAGTTFPIDRHYTAQLLNFDSVYANAWMEERSRLYGIPWCRQLNHGSPQPPLGSDSFITGVQLCRLKTVVHRFQHHAPKENPDVPELVRGKPGEYAVISSAADADEGLPLAYNKDLQEDKIGILIL